VFNESLKVKRIMNLERINLGTRNGSAASTKILAGVRFIPQPKLIALFRFLLGMFKKSLAL
jgi:hypothetical protein